MGLDAVSFFETKFSTGLFYGKNKKKELKEISELARENNLTIDQAEKILDIGYHSPLEIREIKEKHPSAHVVALDITAKRNKRFAIEFKGVSTISIITQNVNSLDFELGYFSTIYCLRMLNLVKDLDDFLKRCFSILKKNSYLILSLDHTETFIPNYLDKYQKNLIETKCYSITNVLLSIKKAGFLSFSKRLDKLSLELIIAYKK